MFHRKLGQSKEACKIFTECLVEKKNDKNRKPIFYQIITVFYFPLQIFILKSIPKY